MGDEAWQPTRRYLERLAATLDWGEVLVAANLCFEPIVGTLIRRELGTRAAAAHGDTVTPVLARAETQEWEWSRRWMVQLTRFVLADDVPRRGQPRGDRQLDARLAAPGAGGRGRAGPGGRGDRRERRARHRADPRVRRRLLADAGLPECCALVGHEAPPEVDAAPARPVRRAPRAQRRTATAPAREASANGAYDYVGIVMAKSAEGDAVARCLRGQDGIEVLEQASFWDIRARDRLVIDYDEVSQALGYAIDAYSIQHEMSTHYGRMVAGDDALMLFSDPTEAMEHLLS